MIQFVCVSGALEFSNFREFCRYEQMLKRSSLGWPLLEKSLSNLSLHYCSLLLAEEICPSQFRRKII